MSRLTRDFLFTMDPLRYLRSLNFEPYEWQQRILTSPHRRKLVNGARRAGKSRIISGKPCHKARFFDRSVTLVLAAAQAQAIEDIRLVQEFIAMDPDYPEVVRASDQQVEIANGSRIIVVPATEVSARGYPNPDLLIVDEAAYVRRQIFVSCILPMLNGNPGCELILISSPHGRAGDPGQFFYEAYNSPRWERYEVRSPYDVDPADPLALIDAPPEAEYRAELAKRGVMGFYSPRHRDREEQEFQLAAQGVLEYRQNQCCEFVEPEEQVFSYSDIERAFAAGVQPLAIGSIGEAPVSPFFSPQD